MKQRLLALLMAAGLVLALAACDNSAATGSADPSHSPSGDASASPSQEVVADLSRALLDFSAGMEPGDTALTVNGQEVPADLFLYWLALNCTTFDMYYQSYGMTVADYADQLFQDSLDLTTYYILLEQKAMESGCPLTDEQRAQIQEDMLAGGQETYEQQKTLFGLSDDTMEYIFSVSHYYDNLLEALTQEPTQEELNNYVYQAKHILLLTVDMEGTPTLQEDGTYAYPSLDEETIAEKKQLADDLLSQLRTSDDPQTLFDELMAQYSEDTGLESYPDGYTTTVGQMVPEFEQTALSLGFGEISDVVESSYGYHIILRGEVEDLDSYAEVYRQTQLDSQVDQWLEDTQVACAPEVENLDVGDFYAKYTAWQAAMAEQLQPEESGSDASSSPAPSAAASTSPSDLLDA